MYEKSIEGIERDREGTPHGMFPMDWAFFRESPPSPTSLAEGRSKDKLRRKVGSGFPSRNATTPNAGRPSN
jgi:hypothetical protein